MQAILLKVLKTLALKMLTEAFLSRVLVAILRELAVKTTNKVDDQLVDAFEDAMT